MDYTFATSPLKSWSAFLKLRNVRVGHGRLRLFLSAVPARIGGKQSELPNMTSEALKAQSRKNLATLARRRGISRWHSMTKPELVRALLRMASAKRVTASDSRRSRRPASRDGHKRNGKNHSKNGQANAAFLPMRDRDLCTTEVDDRIITGRR